MSQFIQNNPTDFSSNLASVKRRVADACVQSGRATEEITLIAVSKAKPWSSIVSAHRAGQKNFGENYLQEARPKIEQSQKMDIEWHFIGAVQTNKTRMIAANFNWLHTLDRIKIAHKLNKQRPLHLPPLNVFIQVNISQEANKAGVDPAQLPSLIEAIQQLPRLQLRGLMCIPRATQHFEVQLIPFQKLQQILIGLQADYPDLQQLSMGMSADLEAAIIAGATHIRIGTDLFGARN